jgi:hypothetical protein
MRNSSESGAFSRDCGMFDTSSAMIIIIIDANISDANVWT